MGRTIIYFNAKLCQPDHQTKGPESDHSGQKPYPMSDIISERHQNENFKNVK